MRIQRAVRRVRGLRASCRDTRMSRAKVFSARRGASMVETGLGLLIFLTTTFGMLELSIANLNEHLVNNAARQAARIAAVHGTMAPPVMTQWGPGTMSIDGNDTGELGTAIHPFLKKLRLSKTTVTLTWLDGDSKPGSRVQATVVTSHKHILSFVFKSTWTITGQSTLQISH